MQQGSPSIPRTLGKLTLGKLGKSTQKDNLVFLYAGKGPFKIQRKASSLVTVFRLHKTRLIWS